MWWSAINIVGQCQLSDLSGVMVSYLQYIVGQCQLSDLSGVMASQAGLPAINIVGQYLLPSLYPPADQIISTQFYRDILSNRAGHPLHQLRLCVTASMAKMQNNKAWQAFLKNYWLSDDAAKKYREFRYLIGCVSLSWRSTGSKPPTSQPRWESNEIFYLKFVHHLKVPGPLG